MERELFVEYAQCKKIQKFAKTGGGGLTELSYIFHRFRKEIENINIINLISVQNEKQITCLNGTLRCDFVNTSLVGRMG